MAEIIRINENTRCIEDGGVRFYGHCRRFALGVV